MNRRIVLKSLSAAALGVLAPQAYGARERLKVLLAGYDYDRVAALLNDSVEIAGADYRFEVDSIGPLNSDALGGPMTRTATEIGMIPYLLSREDGLANHWLIPVFPLRVFRNKSIFIRPDRGIRKPEDLKGKRIASPGYSSTSLTWIRGILQDEYGISPGDVSWVISRKDSSAADSGGPSRFEQIIPEGLDLVEGPPGVDESDLLVEGEVDALFHAAQPKAFIAGDPRCVRLFEDSRAAEQDYYRRTGIFPVMHGLAVRKDVLEAHPWLGEALFRAYSAAKARTYAFHRSHAWYKTTQPWISQELEETRSIMGDNFYSYGMTDNNRRAVDVLLRYAAEQRLTRRRHTIEELFHPASLKLTES